MPEISIKTEAKKMPFSINDEEFVAWQVPGMAFMELIGQIGDGQTEQQQAVVMFEVFKSTMEEEEYERFRTFARSPKNGVTAEVLFDLITKLVEGSASRPTELSSVSSDSPSSGEATSEVNSSQAG